VVSLSNHERASDAAVRFQENSGWYICPFHDEALSGEWKGHRSFMLGLQGRVIYQVVANVLMIQVVQASAHDYRRP